MNDRTNCYNMRGELITHFTQWDYGWTIAFRTPFEEEVIYVDFCNKDSTEAKRVIPTSLGDQKYTSVVPNEMFLEAMPVFIYVVVKNNDDSITTELYTTIPVREKTKPQDYEFKENVEVVSLIALSDEMKALMQLFSEQEDERIANEDERVQNEIERQSNEEERQENESQRQSNEEERQENESQRQENEEERQSNEEERIANETERQSNEQERQDKEAERQANEEVRIENENQRQSNEEERLTNEEERLANENQRQTNEEERQANEEERQDNEAERQANEEVRIANEEQRVADHEKCQEATDAANEAADNANTAADKANEAVQGIIDIEDQDTSSWYAAFTEADVLELIESEETFSTLFGKILKFMDSPIKEEWIDYVFFDRADEGTLYFYRTEATYADSTVTITLDSDKSYMDGTSLVVPDYFWILPEVNS